MKVQRLVAASFLALLLVVSAPAAMADGMDNPDPSPHGFICDLGECLSQAVVLGFEIVSSAL